MQDDVVQGIIIVVERTLVEDGDQILFHHIDLIVVIQEATLRGQKTLVAGVGDHVADQGTFVFLRAFDR